MMMVLTMMMMIMIRVVTVMMIVTDFDDDDNNNDDLWEVLPTCDTFISANYTLNFFKKHFLIAFTKYSAQFHTQYQKADPNSPLSYNHGNHPRISHTHIHRIIRLNLITPHH